MVEIPFFLYICYAEAKTRKTQMGTVVRKRDVGLLF